MVKVSKRSVAQQTHTDRCHRCGGLMVPEQVFEIGSIDWRCVSCGERIDPVILASRSSRVQKPRSCSSAMGNHT
jgi:hypothetical protein